jgi:4-amino-4-deoxy-L-arabinose transferase-like glycosyltransferase
VNSTSKQLFVPSFFHYACLALLLWLAFYLGCGAYAILDMNEGLYAEIAREMLSTQNYLIPHLNAVPYLEKPPLLYWLIALSYHVFGVSAFAARIVPSSCAVLACLSLIWFGKKIERKRQAWLAALILASSLGFCLIGRTVFFDMLLNLWLWLSLWCFYLWYQTDGRKYLRLAYFALALGLLTKGFVALIFPVGSVILFLLSEPCSWRKRLALFDGWGIAVFFLVALPWHVAAVVKQPHFAWDYFINEQWYRFLDKRIPNDYHTGPWYFYFPYILAYLFPWSLLLPALLKTNFKDPLQKFLALSFLVPMVFYSLSRAKGDYYMVVGMPQLAMLLGIRINAWLEIGKLNLLKALFFGLATLALLALGLVYWVNFHTGAPVWAARFILPPELKTAVLYSLLAYIGFSSLMAGLILWKRYPLLPVLALAGFSQLLVASYVLTRPLQQAKYSQHAAAHYLAYQAKGQAVYLYQDFERLSSLLFYLRQRLPIIASKSHDLYFGSHTPEAKGWFLTDNEFLQQCKTQVCWVVLRSDRLNDLQNLVGKAYHAQRVFEQGRTLIYRMQPLP